MLKHQREMRITWKDGLRLDKGVGWLKSSLR